MPNDFNVISKKSNENIPKYFGNYRGIVIDNHDPLKYGRVRIFIPDLMDEDDKENSIWFMPQNQIIGGTNNNECYSLFIPSVDSYVWVFFEGGNPEFGFYQNQVQLMKTVVQPEFQIGKNPENKSGFKFKNGSQIISSYDDEITPDDSKEDEESNILESDERIEICGKKKVKDEVYQIIGNQKTILIDERNGKEKILIEDNKGNHIMISTQTDKMFITCNKDIQIQNYENDISIMQNKGNLNLFQDKNISIEQMNDINIKQKKDIKITSVEGNYYKQIEKDININSNNGSHSIITKNDINNISQNGKLNINQKDNINLETQKDFKLKQENCSNDFNNLIIKSDNVNINNKYDINIKTKNKSLSVSEQLNIESKNDSILSLSNTKIINNKDFILQSKNINLTQQSELFLNTNIMKTEQVSEINMTSNQKINLKSNMGIIMKAGQNTTEVGVATFSSTQPIQKFNTVGSSSQYCVPGMISGPSVPEPIMNIMLPNEIIKLTMEVSSILKKDKIEIIDVPFNEKYLPKTLLPTFTPLGSKGDDQDRNYPRTNYNNSDEYIDPNEKGYPTNIILNDDKQINYPKSTFKIKEIVSENNYENYLNDKEKLGNEKRNKYNSKYNLEKTKL